MIDNALLEFRPSIKILRSLFPKCTTYCGYLLSRVSSLSSSVITRALVTTQWSRDPRTSNPIRACKRSTFYGGVQSLTLSEEISKIAVFLGSPIFSLIWDSLWRLGHQGGRRLFHGRGFREGFCACRILDGSSPKSLSLIVKTPHTISASMCIQSCDALIEGFIILWNPFYWRN